MSGVLSSRLPTQVPVLVTLMMRLHAVVLVTGVTEPVSVSVSVAPP